MRRILLILILVILNNSLVFAAPKKMIPAAAQGDVQLPHIFIYTLPDDYGKQDEYLDEKDAEESDYQEVSNQQEAVSVEYEEDDENPILKATVLKGYAKYVEDSDVVYLKDEDNNFVLNIKNPQKISASKGLNLLHDNYQKRNYLAKGTEYFIAPNTVSTSAKIGNFTIGAQYNNEVDRYAMLETEAGLFTKYEKDRFALSTSVAKSLDTTYSKYSNSFSVTPELHLNNYMSIRNTFNSNVTYNKHSYQLMLSINPFGRKESDRLKIELGAKEIYNAATETTSSQLLFSTKFKL